MKNTLLLWDIKENYSKKTAKSLAIKDTNIIYSTQNIKDKDLADIQAIVLLLETNIEDKNRAQFYGLEIIKILRKDLKYKGLIIPCSFMPLAYFKKQKSNTEVLLTSGVEFKQIGSDNLDKDTLSSHIRDFLPLSDQLLEDLSYYVFDNGGRIRELLHNLKNELREIKNKEDKEELRMSLLNKIYEYATKIKNNVKAGKENELSSIVKNIKTKIEKGLKSLDDNTSEYPGAADFINDFNSSLEKLGSIKEADAPDEDDNDLEKKPWQVLYLEDDAGTREKVKGFFKAKEVICHTPTCEDEVFEILDNNKEFISLFITDIRLMDEDGKWWNKQGYDFIKEIADSNKYPLTYAVLTSKRGFMFDRLKEKQSLSIQWFNKEDVIDNKYAFNLFYDEVATNAEENYLANRIFKVDLWDDQKKPTISKYEFNHIDYYKRYRTSAIYKIKEQEINNIAADCLKKYKNNSTNKLNTEPVLVKEWQKGLKSPNIDDCIEDFADYILLGRRICLAFISQDGNISPDDILKLMTNSESKAKKEDSKVKRFFNTAFRLSTMNDFGNLRKQIYDYNDNSKKLEKGPGILKEEYDFIFYELPESLNKRYTKYFTDCIESIISTLKFKNSKIPEEFSNLTNIDDREILNNKSHIEKGFKKISELDLEDSDDHQVNYTAILKSSPKLKNLVDLDKNQLTQNQRHCIKDILKDKFNIKFG